MKLALKTIVLAAAMLATGCAKDRQPPQADTFTPEGEPRRVTMFADAQAAVGAREDGTLYAWHFDGKDLSPLGREKLDQMVAADTLDTLKVYLDVKEGTYADRSKSVMAYLQDKGLATAHVKVIDGINDNTLKPAAENIAMYNKTDTAESSSTGQMTQGASATASTSTK
jgi:hypothetical protein